MTLRFSRSKIQFGLLLASFFLSHGNAFCRVHTEQFFHGNLIIFTCPVKTVVTVYPLFPPTRRDWWFSSRFSVPAFLPRGNFFRFLWRRDPFQRQIQPHIQLVMWPECQVAFETRDVKTKWKFKPGYISLRAICRMLSTSPIEQTRTRPAGSQGELSFPSHALRFPFGNTF